MLQIESDKSACPARGSAELEFYPVFHHMICAYVGPQYDFVAKAEGYTCPKCRRAIGSDDHTCEIVGMSARCRRCLKETMVSPAKSATSVWSPNAV
jgi:hypothetical protein